MKSFAIFLLCLWGIVGMSWGASASNSTSPASDKNFSEAAKEVKTEAVKIYQESKEAVIRDFHALKEEIPRGLKEAKEAAAQQSKDALNSASKELQDIHHNIVHPKPVPKKEAP
jgi:hypothetical protein